ncbi:MAG: hypothetical protein V7K26_30225, partial [Nostoc sp.]|uniref:hypothetical protein n=1 Tax=Nostoc sp. TaxID=1180 RepID=UPI002FF7EE37
MVGTPSLCQASSSLKAALDLNWDDPDQKNLALGIRLIRKWQMLTGTGFEKLGYNRRSLKGATKK